MNAPTDWWSRRESRQEERYVDQQKPLKILFLTSSYPRSEDDHAGVFLRHLAHHLCNRGLSIHVLAPSDGASGTLTEGQVNVHRFQYFPKRMQKLAYGSGILHNLRESPSLWIQVPFFVAAMGNSLLRLARKERLDLIHAHWLIPQGLLATFSKSWHRVPVLTTVHGSDAFRLKNGLLDRIKRKVLHKCEAWTANSHATAEALGPDTATIKPHIIPMGVDVERFRKGERGRLRSGLNKDDLVILFVGRVVRGKGVEFLLDALSLLPSSLRPKIRLWVVGEGQDADRLQQRTHGASGTLKVRFWGALRNELLPDFYAAADLLVVPASDTEGQGVVLAEAFAARLCLLATRAGGIEEVVEDGVTGMLVQPGDSQALARAIAKLLTDPELRRKLADNGFLRARNDYAWEIVAARFEDLYRGVVEKAAKGAR